MNRRFLPASIITGIVALLLIGFLFSCSDNPTDVTNNDQTLSGEGDIDPQSDTSFLLSTVDVGEGLRRGIEVWARDLTIEPDSIVSFDLVLVNKTERDIHPPIHFVITRVVPNTVTVVNADGYRDRYPYFDFSDALGEDDVLTPGESTDRVTVQFEWPEPMAFSIGFHLVLGEPPLEGVIAGVVFKDLNKDGHYDPRLEPGVAGVPVELRTASGANARSRTVHTDRVGRYGFNNLPTGVYEVSLHPLPGMRLTTPNPLLVTLVELPDGKVSNFLDAHFGTTPLGSPIERVFGPVPVGPASPHGTRLDTTFVVLPRKETNVRLPDLYFLRVEPPMTMGPLPIYIDRVRVRIDDEGVFRFDCNDEPPCHAPSARVLLEPGRDLVGEHKISIEVLGNERSFMLFSIEREEWREPRDKDGL